MAARRLGLAGCAVALVVGGCGPVDLERETAAASQPPPMRLVGVAFEGWSGAVRELAVEARRADVDPGTRVARLDEVRIALRGSAELGPLEVRAPRGEFDLGRDALRLRGGVEGRTRPGERFATDELHFDHTRGLLQSDTAVHVERDNLVLDAAAMNLDLRARHLRLRGPVRAELDPR